MNELYRMGRKFVEDLGKHGLTGSSARIPPKMVPNPLYSAGRDMGNKIRRSLTGAGIRPVPMRRAAINPLVPDANRQI